MSEQVQPTQVLLKPAQHAVLTEMARREGRTVSDLVQTIVGRELERRPGAGERALRRRLEALERIKRHRTESLARRGGKAVEPDVAAMIRAIRKERDEEILARVSDHRH